MPNKKKVYAVTPVGVGAFCWIHKPDTGHKYSNNKHKVTLVLEPDVDLEPIRKLALEAASQEDWGEDYDPEDLKMPFASGDGKKQEEFHGKILFNAASKYAPKVIDGRRQPFPKGVFARSGDEMRLVVLLYPYQKTEKVKIRENGKMIEVDETVYGVSAQLDTVQVVRKHSGGGAGASMLDDIEDGYDASQDEPEDPSDDMPAADGDY